MSYRVDRCQEPTCRRTIHLDDAVACPCGAVVCCEWDDPAEVCDDCRGCEHEWALRPESDTYECEFCGIEGAA